MCQLTHLDTSPDVQTYTMTQVYTPVTSVLKHNLLLYIVGILEHLFFIPFTRPLPCVLVQDGNTHSNQRTGV